MPYMALYGAKTNSKSNDKYVPSREFVDELSGRDGSDDGGTTVRAEDPRRQSEAEQGGESSKRKDKGGVDADEVKQEE